MAAPKVFISHASADAQFANRLANDLRATGADIWVDSSHMGAGDFVARLNHALQGRDLVVLVLSPSAIQSPWVSQEFNAAIARSHQGLMRPPLVVMCQPCPLDTIPPLWTVYHRYDATQDYANAIAGLQKAVNQPAPFRAASITAASAPSLGSTPPSTATTYVDALRSNTHGWFTDGRIYFRNDGLHIKNFSAPLSRQKQAWSSLAPFGRFGNVIISVKVRIVDDAEYRGASVLVRHVESYFDYTFSINAAGQWGFAKNQGPGSWNEIVPWTYHNAVRVGPNTSNNLKVSAVGSHFEFFVNDIGVGRAEDAMYPTGSCGLQASCPVEAIFNDLVISGW